MITHLAACRPRSAAAFGLALLALSACATTPRDVIAALAPYCGKAFTGRLVSNDAVDADFAKSTLVMHVRDCEADTVRIPLSVGEDRSRTWVLTRTPDGLRLKHDHRHKDGSEDILTQYGGDGSMVSPVRAEFPADAASIALFLASDRAVSVTNVWAVEVDAEAGRFAYELRRPERFFRLEFDLTAPVATPPAHWGAQE
jgi:hypothetical protein